MCDRGLSSQERRRSRNLLELLQGMSEIGLKITKVNGEPTAAGVIGCKRAAILLGCSPNTVRKYARKGKLGYFWVNYNEPGEAMLLYRCDVLALKKQR